MSTPAEATAKTTPDPHWIALIAEMLPEERRLAWYRDLSPWLRSLPPEDEFGRIAYAMGFLALLIRETPPQLAEQRAKYAELSAQLARDMNAALKSTAAYHQKLEQRLTQLPAEFAQGVKPEIIAQKMSESFRQQIAQTGLDDTSKALAVLAQQLRKSIGEFDQALQPITDRYRSLGSTVESETNRIVQATGRLRQETDRLLTQTREDLVVESATACGRVSGWICAGPQVGKQQRQRRSCRSPAASAAAAAKAGCQTRRRTAGTQTRQDYCPLKKHLTYYSTLIRDS